VKSLTAILLLTLGLGACVSDQQAQAPLSLHPHNATHTEEVATTEPAASYAATAIDSLVIPSSAPPNGPSAQ
jgi:PBP1b-binding outer membrane lipoprotein LpoB